MPNQEHQYRTSSTPDRRRLSEDEVRRILTLAKEDPRLQDLYDVANIVLHTGIRLNELSNLRRDDLDLPNRRVAVFSQDNARTHRAH